MLIPALARRMIVGMALLFGFWLLGFSSPAIAATPNTCRIGSYLVSLHDFNPPESSFGADYWIWSVCPSKELAPLKQMDMVSAKSYNTFYESEQETKDETGDFRGLDKVYWSQHKAVATLRYDWDLRNYPFDRHTLEIPMEEAQTDISNFVYTPDTVNSSYDKDIRVNGWSIKDFRVYSGERTYRTTFGDPTLTSGESTFTRFVMAIDVQRNDIAGFFSLTAGVYTAFAAVLLSFFLQTKTDFGGRTSLLIGSLFAILVSMQRLGSVLGSSAGFSLINAIHVITLIYSCLAILATLYSRLEVERGDEKGSFRFDRRICLPVFAISFTTINALMITNAIWQG